MTTILDAAAPSFVVREIRRHLSGNNPGPPYLALGPFLGHPDGYGTPGENRAKTKEEVDSCFDFLNALKTHGLKLPIERGWNQFGKKTYPCHSRETLTLNAMVPTLKKDIHNPDPEFRKAAKEMLQVIDTAIF